MQASSTHKIFITVYFTENFNIRVHGKSEEFSKLGILQLNFVRHNRFKFLQPKGFSKFENLVGKFNYYWAKGEATLIDLKGPNNP